jgi:hypothetical protein
MTTGADNATRVHPPSQFRNAALHKPSQRLKLPVAQRDARNTVSR